MADSPAQNADLLDSSDLLSEEKFGQCLQALAMKDAEEQRFKFRELAGEQTPAKNLLSG